MEMPAFLPFDLEFLKTALTDDQLFDQLTAQQVDIIIFFQFATDDETWSENHSDLMRKILTLMTTLSFENKLEMIHLKNIQQKIQEHIKILDPLLPLDIIFEVEGEEFYENNLLFAASSSFFQDLIRNECFYKKSNKLLLDDISVETFKIVEKFVITGSIPDLWKKQESELNNLHHHANHLRLKELEFLCENILKRYINRDNCISMLIQAHIDTWGVLRDACYEYINELQLGFKFHKAKPEFLVFEFFEFKENSLDVFNQVKQLITHLIVRGKLIESVTFSDVVNQCPLLIHLNISMTEIFSERIFDAPIRLAELDISSCNWLNTDSLKLIVEKFRYLKVIKLSDNIQLDYNSWGSLSKLKNLIGLDVSRNSQINDDIFKLILQSSPQITDLDCSECKKIGDKGFFELTRSLTHLMFLNLERCQISDGILLEIASRLRFLEEINLTRCQLLTDRGVLGFVKQSRALKSITIKQCNIKEQTLSEIKQQKTSLVILN